MEPFREKEKDMVCPFCKDGVQAVVGPDPDAQDLYDAMGCFYPGGLPFDEDEVIPIPIPK